MPYACSAINLIAEYCLRLYSFVMETAKIGVTAVWDISKTKTKHLDLTFESCLSFLRPSHQSGRRRIVLR